MQRPTLLAWLWLACLTLAFVPMVHCTSSSCRSDFSSFLQSHVVPDGPQEVASSDQGGSLAICVAGGMRGAHQCADSLVSSMVRPNIDRLKKVGLFVATWTDRQCSNRKANVTEEDVRQIYSKAGVELAGIWMGSPAGQGIPSPFKDTWASHAPEEFPSGSMYMLDGTHHMAKLWQQCLDLVPTDYEVIVHVRPDQYFPPNYKWRFHKTTSAEWEVGFPEQQQSETYVLSDETVYMSLNKYHHVTGTPGTIPDDRLGFGLAKPMRGVFATMDIAADKGSYDVSKADYRKKWGPREADAPPQPHILTPRRAWVRERYPEKLLKHHILQQGFKYKLISDSSISSYDIVGLKKDC